MRRFTVVRCTFAVALLLVLAMGSHCDRGEPIPPLAKPANAQEVEKCVMAFDTPQGKHACINFGPSGQLRYKGDLEPDQAAKMFLEELGRLIDSRCHLLDRT